MEQGIPIKFSLVEACNNCELAECQRKHAESSLELTSGERRMLDSGASIAQIEKARKAKLELEWAKERVSE